MEVGRACGTAACNNMGVESDKLEKFALGRFCAGKQRGTTKEGEARKMDEVGGFSRKCFADAVGEALSRCSSEQGLVASRDVRLRTEGAGVVKSRFVFAFFSEKYFEKFYDFFFQKKK